MFARRARLFANLIVVFVCALFMAGCPAPPKEPPRITPLRPIFSKPGVQPEKPVQTEFLSDELKPHPIIDLIEPVLPEEKLRLPRGILPLQNWSTICGFTETRVAQKDFPQTFELTGPQGKLELTIGQRYAKWNGINIGLGFAPTLRQGQLALHSLDVAKNIYPLVFGYLPLPREHRTLVLDPGHGGRDSGSKCVGRNIYEKDLTLDWALRIQEMLTNSLWEVILTRTNDREVALMDRVRIAETNHAALFLSLHFNSLEAGGGDEAGIETYCLTPTGLPSNINRGYEDDPRRIFPNNQFDMENLTLAARLQSALVKDTGQRDRGVRRARFMTVLREQQRPAVLLEGGYLSNPAEAKLIESPEFRDRLARAVCDSLPD
jgi:N-acetylmuramoyl-L-alanine amidase